MTAVEEIQAAIDKLRSLHSSLGFMALGEDPGELYARVEEDDDDEGNRVFYGLNLTGVDSDEEINSAIVTLHRTIDAQLAILRGVSTRPASTLDMREYDVEALALARAINGVTP